jgi:hypothetical protein
VPDAVRAVARTLSDGQWSALEAIEQGKRAAVMWRTEEALFDKGLTDRSTYASGKPKITELGKQVLSIRREKEVRRRERWEARARAR